MHSSPQFICIHRQVFLYVTDGGGGGGVNPMAKEFHSNRSNQWREANIQVSYILGYHEHQNELFEYEDENIKLHHTYIHVIYLKSSTIGIFKLKWKK